MALKKRKDKKEPFSQLMKRVTSMMVENQSNHVSLMVEIFRVFNVRESKREVIFRFVMDQVCIMYVMLVIFPCRGIVKIMKF